MNIIFLNQLFASIQKIDQQRNLVVIPNLWDWKVVVGICTSYGHILKKRNLSSLVSISESCV
uniref:Uncharacterized protein n=1 Tax=Helianthus annuus TaxID=4232 RepID=A0A251S5C3_HELAN